MEETYALNCSSNNLRYAPDLNAGRTYALHPQDRVEVLEDAGSMVRVQVSRWKPPATGFLLKSAVITSPQVQEIFPKIEIKPGLSIPAVPRSIPASTFLAWLDSGIESPWLPADHLSAIRTGGLVSVGELVRQAISDHREEWETWISEIREQGRLTTATIDEWLVIMAGGRAMWSLRPERLFAKPSEHSAAPAWVAPEDVLRWTGHVRFNDAEPKYKQWYEVELTKLDKQFKGWYKASLLEEFIFPTLSTDLANEINKQTVFDLSHPQLRIPADAEIDEARKAGRTGAQYIQIKQAIGTETIKHNLCGEFCVAALVGSDVLPFLKQWLASDQGALPILKTDAGTSILDLQKMLDAYHKGYEFFRAETSVAPITPSYVRRMLDTGRMAIVGTGITYNGVVKSRSYIRHWIVIEDIILVGNSGWVRIYNPFADHEEVYPFDVVFDINSRSAIGLWVTPSRP